MAAAFSWDYGMTDGHNLFKAAMYAYKAAGISRISDSFSQPGKIPHRPALFGLWQGPGHNMLFQEMHNLGMTTLAFDTDYMHKVVLGPVPDMFGMTEEQIQEQPPLIQYLKCEGGIEAGQPGCKDNKFNNTKCDPRKARTSWHPGWK